MLVMAKLDFRKWLYDEAAVEGSNYPAPDEFQRVRPNTLMPLLILLTYEKEFC